MFVGATVFDRRTRATAVVRYIEHVPPTRDLFGLPIPAHRRFIIEYVDTRQWANDRLEADLVPLAERSRAAA